MVDQQICQKVSLLMVTGGYQGLSSFPKSTKVSDVLLDKYINKVSD